MDMTHALEQLKADFPDVSFFGTEDGHQENVYWIAGKCERFDVQVFGLPSPMCAYVRMKMVCLSLK
jgi:hypothetical protein